MILTSAFTALTALTLTTSAVVLVPRQTPQPKGLDQNSLIEDLNLTTYAQGHCKGDGFLWSLANGEFNAKQMHSYALSRALRHNEQLDFYTGFGTGLPSRYSVDYALDDDVEMACADFDATAGINATTHDVDGEAHGAHVGCHQLENNEGCAMLWLTGPRYS